jgi:hypothetical protein
LAELTPCSKAGLSEGPEGRQVPSSARRLAGVWMGTIQVTQRCLKGHLEAELSHDNLVAKWLGRNSFAVLPWRSRQVGRSGLTGARRPTYGMLMQHLRPD